jgi:hypothetical protein
MADHWSFMVSRMGNTPLHCKHSSLMIATILSIAVKAFLVLCSTALAVAGDWSAPGARAVVVDTCESTVQMERYLDVAVGDSVLIYQACGAVVDDSGTVTDLATAGMWSVHRVEEANGNQLALEPRLPPYQPMHGVQVCKLITASHLEIRQPLRVPPWDHGAGGLLSLWVDTLVLASTIDASGSGFPGGAASRNNWDTSCADQTVAWSSGKSGGKGLGHACAEDDANAGRAPRSLGGGGGNARNAGGGGGSLGGDGGEGGYQTSEYGGMRLGGMGAHAYEPNNIPERILMGGGGGGGHQNDFLGSPGGSSGGIVFVHANLLLWEPGAHILANGESAFTAIGDGSGGGGAGGSIILDVDSIVRTVHSPPQSVLDVEATGGRGGSTWSEVRMYGPGGGGGGGMVYMKHRWLQDTLSVSVAGGMSGFALGTPCELTDSAYGAQAGSAGIVRSRIPDQASGTQPCGVPDLVVSTEDTSGVAGEHVGVRLTIDANSARAEPLTLRLRLRARATVMWPEGPFWWSGRRYTTRYLDRWIPAGPPAVFEELLPYQLLLGDSASVRVMIDSVTVDPPVARAVVGHNGVVVVSDVCIAGSMPRLFDPFGEASSMMHTSDDNELMIDLQGRIWRRSDLRSSASWYHQRWRPVVRSQVPP